MEQQGYLGSPAKMSDEELESWYGNFSAQPPTMDYMAEWSWANRVSRERARRQEQQAAA
jgi:hypothetical protein